MPPAVQGHSSATVGAKFTSTETVTAPDDNASIASEIGSEATVTPKATSHPEPAK